MNATEPQTRPANARAYLDLLHNGIMEVNRRLSRLDPSSADPAPDEPVLTLLESILTAIRDIQTSTEVLHQRLDAVARFVPAAARAISPTP